MKGVRFVDAVGLHGERCTLKLGDVEAIYDMAPESVMSSINESRADESDDSLAGGAV